MLTERGEHFVDGKPRTVGIRQQACHERTELPALFSGGSCFEPARRHERTDAAARFEHAGPFEVRVHARNRVRVDAQLDRELTDSWQLIAGVQPPGGDGGSQTVLDLRVDGRPVPRVDREESHLSDYTSSLVQVGQEKSREHVTPGCDRLAARPEQTSREQLAPSC